MSTVVIVNPDQIERWLRLKMVHEKQPCDCRRMKDLTVGLGSDRNLYCPDCKKHIYNGVHFTRNQWDCWINSQVVAKLKDGEVTVHTNPDGKDIEPRKVLFEEFMVMVGSHPHPWPDSILK